jgi:uncharacterized Zn finger protein (UPF0148 family)
MTIVCPECGSVNKKGNKFCFECGMKLPTVKERPSSESEGTSSTSTSKPKSSNEAKRLHLKKKWLKGELTAEEYRGHLLRLRLKERFGSDMLDQNGNAVGETDPKDE